ncbi:hypothetical protein [Nonomuraea sp. GTA35]|uniref:hypothetical protein n=1 Tax=Nonomuraea sp. GTA35 TaxID=1676746 RepID=UPI0035BF60C0
MRPQLLDHPRHEPGAAADEVRGVPGSVAGDAGGGEAFPAGVRGAVAGAEVPVPPATSTVAPTGSARRRAVNGPASFTANTSSPSCARTTLKGCDRSMVVVCRWQNWPGSGRIPLPRRL